MRRLVGLAAQQSFLHQLADRGLRGRPGDLVLGRDIGLGEPDAGVDLAVEHPGTQRGRQRIDHGHRLQALHARTTLRLNRVMCPRNLLERLDRRVYLSYNLTNTSSESTLTSRSNAARVYLSHGLDDRRLRPPPRPPGRHEGVPMFQQVANPVGGSLALSALVAALPLLTLFVLLGALQLEGLAGRYRVADRRAGGGDLRLRHAGRPGPAGGHRGRGLRPVPDHLDRADRHLDLPDDRADRVRPGAASGIRLAVARTSGSRRSSSRSASARCWRRSPASGPRSRSPPSC